MGRYHEYSLFLKYLWKQVWFKILLPVWGISATYDLLLSQFVPETFSRKFPKICEVSIMTGCLLPFWGWLLILAVIIIIAAVEYAIQSKLQLARSTAKPSTEAQKKLEDNSFKGLDAASLRTQAKRWVKSYSKAGIQRIVLYRYASRYQESLGENIPSKYFVVFETLTGSMPKELESAEKLKSATEYYQTVKKRYLGLMSDDFKEVYKTPPSGDSFKDEWTFFVKKPSDELAIGVITDEPSWVLYP